jgi:hypothetical protein
MAADAASPSPRSIALIIPNSCLLPGRKNPKIFFSQTGVPQPVAHAGRRRAHAAVAGRIGRSIGKWAIPGLKDLQRHLLDEDQQRGPGRTSPEF